MKTAQEIDLMITELSLLEAKYAARKVEATAANDLVDSMRGQLMAELQSQGLDSFKGGQGTISLSTRYSVKFPKDIDVKRQLRDAMGEVAFNAMWGINHQSLNSWYKQEVEQAKANGVYLDLPGLEPTSDTILSFRKNAK